MLSDARLREVLHYKPVAGKFVWKVALSSICQVGSVAGFNWGKGGRIGISIDRKMYFAHRLAFLYMTGEWPTHQVDHINRDQSDNRWENLREATGSQNRVNRLTKSKYGWPRGVSFTNNWYYATITKDGKRRHIGIFRTPEAAHSAYLKVTEELHGEFLPC